MKIVEQSAKILWITPHPLRMIERAGRTAYKSEDLITDTSAEAFVRMILKRGHESVVEHACASVLMVTDRGVSHEIVRHRLFSYTQESTRYCNYGQSKFGEEITVIKPPVDEIGGCLDTWENAMEEAERSYFEMLDDGASPQLARSVLPNSLKTEIVVTGNFREWRHFLKLRTAPAAHPQMQELAKIALEKFQLLIPIVFEDFVA